MAVVVLVLAVVDTDSFTQDLPGLLPTTAASFLLVVLLRIWVLERRSWSTERAVYVAEREALIKAHRDELAEKRTHRLEERALLLREREEAVRVAVADYEAHIRFLREQVLECRAELDELRGRRRSDDGPTQ